MCLTTITESYHFIYMKHLIDFRVSENRRLTPSYGLLKLTPVNGEPIPEVFPGQFVQVAVQNSPGTFLRRPISINNVDRRSNELWLLVRVAGKGTLAMVEAAEGTVFNLLMPLGNSFPTDSPSDGGATLLVGGGVGVAPLYCLGKELKTRGVEFSFLLGARSGNDLLLLDEFRELAPTFISTDDGSAGEAGVVTRNSAIEMDWSRICCCGPAPMMKAVASIARRREIECLVSLENMMACGLGACLCCVEKTVKGNVCVCTEGPIFNINELTWHD